MSGRRPRRGAKGPELVVISWRNIPAQVNAKHGRESARVLLDGRFQRAIDRAAKVAGKTEAHAYTAEWVRTARPCSDDLQAEAEAEAAAFETQFDETLLRAHIRSGGLDPSSLNESSPEPA